MLHSGSYCPSIEQQGTGPGVVGGATGRCGKREGHLYGQDDAWGWAELKEAKPEVTDGQGEDVARRWDRVVQLGRAERYLRPYSPMNFITTRFPPTGGVADAVSAAENLQEEAEATPGERLWPPRVAEALLSRLIDPAVCRRCVEAETGRGSRGLPTRGAFPSL